MRFALIYYQNNTAGKNIVDRFKETAFLPHIPIIETKKEVLYIDIIKEKFHELKNIDFLVFPSIHKSKDNKPALCLHAPGNWRNADYGGKEGKVCMTSSFVMKYLFQKLNKISKENNKVKEKYTISLEATHHGPLTNIPCCFIEIGSSNLEYNDQEAIDVVTKTIFSLVDYKSETWIPSIAIGGPHYAPNFNKIQLNSSYAISHIIPSYSLPLTESMLKEAEEKTEEQIKYILLDWKGCGVSEERNKMLEIIKKNAYKYKRTDKLKG